MRARMVAACSIGCAGCLYSVGPTLAVRVTGEHTGARIGVDYDAAVEVHDNPAPPVLLGGAGGFAAGSGPVRWYAALVGLAMTSVQDNNIGGMAAVAVGASSLHAMEWTDISVYASAAGGAVGGVHCSGGTGSALVGVRWLAGGLELFVSPRVNAVLEIGATYSGGCSLR